VRAAEPATQQAAPTTSAAPAAPAEDASTAVRAADPSGVPVLTGGPATVARAAAQVGEAPTARSVVTQVIPEITRLVSDGEGVHRVTLQLNPKALGEVRVVLTMRHGDVHVRIAGGEEARHALAASSAELTRALQHVGIDEHRLTLTELAPTAASRGTDLHDHPQDRHPPLTGRQPPRPARPEQSLMDG
jgi:flagellar hook-length control protein FliK